MKKRMLFVDDETMVLQGLQRILRPLREDWDMEFFDSASKALQRMESAPFQVVVSDLRMPEMDGADFLKAVAARHPKTIRLILSGYADQELIFKCLDSAHQYLAKPCDPEVLKAVLERAGNLENILESAALRQLVGRLTCLPRIPALYLEVVAAANQPRASLDGIARVISRDPAITAQILRLANSAFFGGRGEMTSTEDAVARLGVELIKTLVLWLGALAQLEPKGSDQTRMCDIWTHSLRVAARAKLIAQFEGADRLAVAHAYTAGILHDIGKLVLAANFPAEWEEAVQRSIAPDTDSSGIEAAIFGAGHAEVGGYLVGLWGLPSPVVEAVTLHHRPHAAGFPSFTPLTAVHAANAYTREAETGSRAHWDETYLDAVGASPRIPFWRATLADAAAAEDSP